MKLLFWVSLGLIFYTYIGYPSALFAISKGFKRRINKGNTDLQTTISIVIAVKNEEKTIKKRIANLLDQDYPKNNLEIIIVSDGSIDTTADVVRSCKREIGNDISLNLIEYPLSRGKSYAVNIGVERATGEIVVFADARQHFAKNAIKELAHNFHDPKVGCVSGELIFYKENNSSIREEIETYWNYEKFVRKLESRIHSVCGATGSIYAIRKFLFKKIPDSLLLDDVHVPMHIVFQGYRTVLDEKAVAYDYVAKDFNAEKRRKIRTLTGNWQLLSIMPSLLSPIKNPIFIQYLSHKVLRLIIPFCFLGCMFSSLFIPGIFYQAALCSAVILLVLPHFESKLKSIKFLVKISKLSRALFNLNYYALLGCFYFISKRENVWIK